MKRCLVQVVTLFAPQRYLWAALLLIGAGGIPVFASDLVEVFTEPFRVVELASAEPGILEIVHVKQGDRVSAGDVLANLDREVLLATLEIAEHKASIKASQHRAEADSRQKRRRFEKIRGLHAKGHASEEEFDSARSTLEISEANVLEVKENQRLAALEVKQIRVQLKRRGIVCPVSGEVISVVKEAGEYVASVDPIVATVVQLDKLRVKFYLDTVKAKSIAKGDLVPLYFADTQQRVNGVVEFVSPTTDADSRTVRVEVVINNGAGDYRSGVPVRWQHESDRQARAPQTIIKAPQRFGGNLK